jgi:poly(A) polymerase
VSDLHPPWLDDAPVQVLLAALGKAGIAARFVGGCVRDALAGNAVTPVGDIDLATPAPPEAVMAALAAGNIRAVPTGVEHGTVTAVLPPRHFEITTLRRDVETDGRHARVAFDAGWDEDAARRDFTINAIYLAPDGTLHDPVGGLADHAAGRVRFVGDPATRIAEDVLRILRYYRFEARFGAGAGDPAARAACGAATARLPSLSAERIWRELKGLLLVNEPVRALTLMQDDRVLPTILPEATRIDRLTALLPLAAADDVILRLAALIEIDRAEAKAVARRLRLSAAEAKRLEGLAAPWPLDPSGDPRAQRLALYRLGRERYGDLILLLAAEGRLKPAALRKLSELVETWPIPVFPLGGDDVTALGIAPGPVVGRLLAVVTRWWEDSDFAAGRDECLAHLKVIVEHP